MTVNALSLTQGELWLRKAKILDYAGHPAGAQEQAKPPFVFDTVYLVLGKR